VESRRAWTAAVIAGMVGLALLFVGVALATDRPGFCPSCHEMRPYSEAWQAGPHDEVWCIDCHVDPGIPARFAHKWIALNEVRAHLAGDTRFPRPVPPEIPDARCIRCHQDVPALIDGFSHADHAEKGTCAECHIHDGHRVTEQTLRAAGIFAADVSPRRLSGRSATAGGGVANLEGHPEIRCTECHDLQASPCSGCHEAPSEPPHSAYEQECPACHKPVTEWAFIHPGAQSRCGDCHVLPDDHPNTNKRSCTDCHRASGESWSFRHPGVGEEHSYRSFACDKCHPSSLSRVSCTCHGGNPPEDD